MMLRQLPIVFLLAGHTQFAAADAAEFANSIGMKLVRIESGSFLMGQDGPPADYKTVQHAERCDQADWDERPAHRVRISRPFHMSTTEVTVGQYRQFKAADGADDEAVTGVSWFDAVKFCEWLSAKEGKPYRLPTEAEWEYACRAGTTTLFHTGDRLPDGFQKWKFNDKLIKRFFSKTGKFPRDYRDWPAAAPLRVAQTPANAWGVFDMHGNVEEWCLDWYGPYEAGEQTDPVGRVDGDFRVTRGGSHSDFTRMLRSANRSGRIPECANDRIGFRVVLGGLSGLGILPKCAGDQTQPLGQDAQATPAFQFAGALPADVPFFSGPKPFVKVPPNLAGPMFSDHNHSPAIAECPNGDLLAVWFSCGDEGGNELAVLASRLRRGASEWEPASPFWDGPDINDHAPKLWFDGERTLFFFAKGLSEDIVRTSTDSGATWSKARVLQPNCEIGNQLLRTREGFLVLPLDGNKPGASLNISRDGNIQLISSKNHCVFNLAWLKQLPSSLTPSEQALKKLLGAGTPDPIPLWLDKPPGFVTNAPPETVSNEARIKLVSVPTISVYLPPKEKRRGLAVVVCAGGGYGGLDWRTHVVYAAQVFNPKGVAVIGLKYRTRPPHKVDNAGIQAITLLDAQRAVRLVRQRAAEWNLDPHRIGIVGYSAGANLAMNLAANFDAGDPKSDDPIERQSSRPDFAVGLGTWHWRKPVNPFQFPTNAPPVYLVHATTDKPVEIAQNIVADLKRLGVPARLDLFEEGGHGVGNLIPTRVQHGFPPAQWPDRLLKWLGEVSKK